MRVKVRLWLIQQKKRIRRRGHTHGPEDLRKLMLAVRQRDIVNNPITLLWQKANLFKSEDAIFVLGLR
ncbi:hypothetical protein CT19431_40083 [Cupriavidus taiwanensis]|nr:hypothetical protein CT19431_40083 [Cupriavidus taiwanensis]